MKIKKNVLMVGPDRNANGGIASVVNQYYLAGVDQRVQLQYLPTTGNGNMLKKILDFGKAILKYPKMLEQADIVHIHMSKGGSFLRKSYFVKKAKKKKKQVVIHMHSSQFIEFYHKAVFLKHRIESTISAADIVIVLSEYWRQKFEENFELCNVIVLRNGVQSHSFVREIYDDQNLLFLGKICREKGMTELFEVIKNIKDEFPMLRLYIAGNGEDEMYHQLCKELKIEEQVKFLGWITGEEKEHYLKKCSMFVLPSYSEGLPVSLLEAMSYGCACIATAVGGVPEVLEEGKSGTVIQSRNIEQLQSALEGYLLDINKKKQHGKNAVHTIAEKYTMDTICKGLGEIYGKDT